MSFYVVTALKPTVVLGSVTGNFTGPNDLNLILNKSNTLEIYLVTPSGLQLMESLPIYGHVVAMELFKPAAQDQQYLFFLTRKLCFSVVRYNIVTETFETMAYGDARELAGRIAEGGPLGLVDPLCRMIGMHLHNGALRVAPMDADGTVQEMFSVRLEETCILDLKLLYPSSGSRSAKPLLAILYAKATSASAAESSVRRTGELSCSIHLSTYYVNIQDKELEEGPYTLNTLDWSATLLAPVPDPCGGLLILGSESITYVNPDGVVKAISTPEPVDFVTYEMLDSDGSRFLLGDNSGFLRMLALVQVDDQVVDMSLERIGETSVASSLSYLDNGFVFVGSFFGDSMLVRLQEDADESGSFVAVHETFPNVGPIVDMAVVDFERQGQGQLVTCSGNNKDGSLRVVRVGVEIHNLAELDLPGVKGMWSLKASSEDSTQKFIVFSFVGETRILGMTEDMELEETELSGFDCSVATLHCRNASGTNAIQVTADRVKLIDLESGNCLAQWSPPKGDEAISLATSNESQVVVAAGHQLFYLRIQGNSLSLENSIVLENQASCLDVDFPLSSADAGSPIVAVGMWDDISIRILRLPSLELATHEVLGGDYIARSVILTLFDEIPYLLCGLGDGNLCSFVIDMETCTLSQQKKISLGTQPLLLHRFQHLGANHIFAASDRPTIIYSTNGKLHYSIVNMKEVNNICSFASGDSPDSLAVSTDSNLVIGVVDDLQKLHVRTVPLGMEPSAIAYQESTSCFLVGAVDMTRGTRLLVFDEKTFDILDEVPMGEFEDVSCIISMVFDDDETEYFVVGSTYVQDEETEPTSGRIVVFEFKEGKLLRVGEACVHGAVYSMSSIQGCLVAAVNGKLEVFKWTASNGLRGLQFVCKQFGHVLTLNVQTRGDFVMGVDLMKSMSIYLFDKEKGTLEEIARHLYQCYGSCGFMIEDDLMLQADTSHNLIAFRRHMEDTSGEEDRERLDVIGEFHLGDSVNLMRSGSLVMHTPEADSIQVLSSTIFATVNGAVGLILQLPAEDFSMLRRVEKKLSSDIISGIGGLKHSLFREFVKTKGSSPAQNFVDGDLLEQVLDLPKQKLEELATSCDVPAEVLIQKIESLAQLH